MDEPVRQPGMVPETSSWRMILTLGGLGFVCGILIVMTFQLTFPVIKRNKAEALERAIFEVMPGAAAKSVFAVDDGKLVPAVGEPGPEVRYYACYDLDRRLIGVAVEAQGQGFQDLLRVIYGYSTRESAIVGLKVLDSRETPGLGDKIETDPAFRANFDALAVALSEDKTGIMNPITMVKPGQKTASWQIEAITGATISSQAIADILEKSTKETVPVIMNNLATMEAETP